MESAHHFSSRPDCNSTADVPSLILRTALITNRHSFPICVVLTYNDSKFILHKLCQIPRNCQCKWLLVSLSAPRSSHGYDCIHWVAKVLHHHSVSNCAVEEKFLSLGPHLHGRQCAGLFYHLNLREDEGQEEVLEDKDEEEEESGVDEKVKEVRENAQLMHATWWWPWDGMRRKHEYLEPVCDVQGMSVTTAKQRLTTKTATLRACSRVPQVLSRCTHCWVSCCASCWSCASCRQWCSCRCDRPLNPYPKFFAHFTSRKRVFWGVVFTPSVGYSRPPSAVNDLSVTK